MISDAVALLERGVASSAGQKATDQNKRELLKTKGNGTVLLLEGFGGLRAISKGAMADRLRG